MKHSLYRYRFWHRFVICVFVALVLGIILAPVLAVAQTQSPALAAEQIRTRLLAAQLALSDDPIQAQIALGNAEATYAESLAPLIATTAPEAARAAAGFAAAKQAFAVSDQLGFADARTDIWTALLAASMHTTISAIQRGDGTTAKTWLALREFRQASRVAHPTADATRAITNLIDGTATANDTLAVVRADLLDTYQARLNDALDSLVTPAIATAPIRQHEAAALVTGYFAILAPAYREQRGDAALLTAQAAVTRLGMAVQSSDAAMLTSALTEVRGVMNSFRAAPLSDAEKRTRAAKVVRYLALVGPNYGRGVHGDRIINQIEVDEARTFRIAAANAFTDLVPDLQGRDVAQSAALMATLNTLRDQIASIAPPETVQATADAAGATFQQVVPAEWLQNDPSADFDSIRELLNEVEKAVGAGQYPQAESARLDAYAILDAGAEIRLRALAPDQATALSGLFWQGTDTLPGLATLVSAHAPLSDVRRTTAALNTALTAAQTLVGSGVASPGAVIGNAAVIIFRQGLEAVVILASILAGLRKPGDTRFRRPLIWGAAAAGAATVATWGVLRVVLNQFAQFGGRLEAIVSMIAVAVLLVILNWFFHTIYWVGWLSGIQKRKKRSLLSPEAGQMLALVAVGFTSVYREGFETALFSQVLVLEAGPAIVLQGLLLGALPVVVLGLITFRFGAKLPYKTLLIISGVLIVSVLIQMVGQTIHAMQAVRWMTVSPMPWLPIPYWMGVWFGLYPTWESFGAQLGAATIVGGSYVLAEHQQQRRRSVATQSTPSMNAS